MGSEQAESEVKLDFDDSGCVQDGSPKKQAMENGYTGQAALLDLSDDVLLCILKYCSPHDLKALGFTCSRLGSLVLERSLWSHVDARSVGYGKARARWLLTHALHDGTHELQLSGFAREARGCLGYVNKTRKQVEDEIARRGRGGDGDNNNTNSEQGAGSTEEPRENSPEPTEAPEPPYPLFRQHARLHINAHQLPRMSGSPTWHEESDSDGAPRAGSPPGPVSPCDGPHFTLTAHCLRLLRERCPHLTALTLAHCNINCSKMSINNFPPTLKKLSLRGTKCYNLPLDKSFLFKIHDYLPLLEYLDLSECEWLEPAALLPLSKISTLETLLMKDCPGMTEFVAYVSLATRYGFRKLKILDFRGSPVGDSEVSALGWLPVLQQLFLSAPAPPAALATHHHYQGDPRHTHDELEAWELEEPDYYKDRQRSASQSPDTSVEDVDEQVEQIRQRFNQPSDHISIEVFTRPRFQGQRLPSPPEPQEPREPPKRKVDDNSTHTDDSEPGPSKRAKTDDSPKEKEKKEKTKKKPKKHDDACCSKDGRLSIEITFGFTDGPSGSGVQDKSKKERDDKTETESQNDEEDSEKEKSGDKAESEKVKEEIKKEESDEKDDGDSESLKESENNSDVSDLKGESSVKEELDEAKESDDKADCQSEIDDKKSPDNDIPSKSNKCTALEKNWFKRFFYQGASTSRSNPATFEDEPPAKKIRTKSGNETKHTEYKDQEQEEKEKRKKADCQSEIDDKKSPDNEIPSKSNKCTALEKNWVKRFLNQGASTSRSNPATFEDEPPAKKIRTKSGNETKDTENKDQEQEKKEKRKSRSKDDNESSDDSDDSDDTNDKRPPPPSGEGPSRMPDPRPGDVIHIVRNQDPVVIQCPLNRREEQLEPRHHVLYVNLGQQLHAVYRLLPNRVFRNERHRDFRNASTERLDSSSLVTDSAIRRFGRADGEDINIVHIGPNGPQIGGRDTSGRPNRSNLRVLSATGYRGITNRSLIHLATAAPELRTLDFSNTGVTAEGVENFRSLRPDCEVVFSTFKDSEESLND